MASKWWVEVVKTKNFLESWHQGVGVEKEGNQQRPHDMRSESLEVEHWKDKKKE